MPIRPDESAASSALAFIVAGVLFLAAVTVLIVTANDRVPPEQPVEGGGYQDEAEGVLALLTQSPGLGWGEEDLPPEPFWDGAPANYRPSLVDETGAVDPERLWTWQTDCADASVPVPPPHPPSGYRCVEYGSARESFGLNAEIEGVAYRLDFHLEVLDRAGVTVLEFGPPLPQQTGETASNGAATNLRVACTPVPPASCPSPPESYEIRVFVFLGERIP